jgi:prepilin-type N-terminal cleavage/methylation domain-containing protein
VKAVVKKKRSQKRRGAFSLIELLVVMTIVAALVALAIPAINAMQKSFNSTGTESMISAALATARTLAISNQQYVGVRFQKAGDPNNASKADQYMIFIIYNSDKTNLTCGFIAVDGYKPMKLPENVRVMDKMVRTSHSSTPRNCDQVSENSLVEADLGNNVNIADISTFSIVFSPAGKLVSHEIRCRNNDGEPKPKNPPYYITLPSDDTIFNGYGNVVNDANALFLQDDFDEYGIGVEMSRREFYIYNRNEFEKLTTGGQRWNYLNGPKTERFFVNAYTGELIK